MPAEIAIFMTALVVVIAAALAVIIRRIISFRKAPIFLLLFLILPIGQLFTLYAFNYDEWSMYWMIGLLLGVGANILLLIYAVSREKTAAANEELNETRHRIELEKSHYEATLLRREEFNKIRLDFSERLEAAAELACSGEDDTARGVIAELAAKIGATKENAYCAIPVINAVLTEKAREAAEAGVELTVDLHMPQTLAVEPMHLCSIFANLLDNAIAACKSAGGAGKPVIRLSSLPDGDYLFIKVLNPSGPGKKSPPGFGTRILTELAERYGGGYQTEYGGGLFTAVVSLLTEEAEGQ